MKAKSKVLHDPIAPKERKASRVFISPSKEKATTGRFMSPGDDYGIGFRVNVGKEKASSIYDGPIPFGCDMFAPDEAIE